MKKQRQLLLLLAVSIIAWACMTWPLPRYAGNGIGAASVRHNWHDDNAPRMMIPGDHLQLLYRFWMAQDMVAGKTPVWRNVYEFNYRGDADRRQPGFLYMPFSLLYAAIAPWGGQALAWNLVGLLSLIVTGLATFRWARRYSGSSPGPAMVAALCCMAFPYRIHNLLGGSPAGFAMMWVPLLLDGLDRAILDRRIRGGVQAGVSLLFAAWTDMQVFAFCTLVAAGWTAIAQFLLNRPDGWRWRSIKQSVLPLSPALVLGAAGVICVYTVKSAIDASVHMTGGRGIDEVLKFTPEPLSLFRFWRIVAGGELVYLGVAGLLCVFVGLLFAWRRRAAWRVGFALLVLLLVVVGWFSVGPRAPDHGFLFKLARAVMPPLKMMRQPAKALCVFAPLYGLALALTVRSISPRRPTWCAAGIGLVVLLDFSLQTRPAISLIADEQPAYQLVAEYAAARGTEAHALALPLWPGDTHWSGVYTHYASLYRIRMVNGYSPVVPQHYYDAVFDPLRSLNSGHIGDAQLDLISAMQVSHILLHEDAFPEKVSPFPVAETLRALLANPRLRPEPGSGDRVWAFRILERADPAAAVVPPVLAGMDLFPTRCFSTSTTQLAADDPQKQRARFHRAGIVQRPDTAFWLRTRGNGRLRVRHVAEKDDASSWESDSVRISSEDWQWITLPVTNISGYVVGRPEFEAERGHLDVEWLMFTAGHCDEWLARSSWELPGITFFHGGQSDLKDGSVSFMPAVDPAGGVLYGPRLPLPAGDYQAELLFSSDGESGHRVATLAVDNAAEAAVRVGERCLLQFSRQENTPATFVVYYRAKEPLTVHALRIVRLL